MRQVTLTVSKDTASTGDGLVSAPPSSGSKESRQEGEPSHDEAARASRFFRYLA